MTKTSLNYPYASRRHPLFGSFGHLSFGSVSPVLSSVEGDFDIRISDFSASDNWSDIEHFVKFSIATYADGAHETR